MLHFLHAFTREPEMAPRPLGHPPKKMRPVCKTQWAEETSAISTLALRLASETTKRFAAAAVYDSAGSESRMSVRGVCEQYKSLLRMTPR